MMTSRERVYATLGFQGPDRIPTQLWTLPAAYARHGDALHALTARYPGDFGGVGGESIFDIDCYQPGTSVDVWGCEWLTLLPGAIGEVKRAPLADYAALASYRWPKPIFGPAWAQAPASIAAQQDKFLIAWAGDPWERMQFLRGPENLYADLADEDCAEVYELRDRVFDLVRVYVEHIVTLDVDAVSFFDDWGSQWSLLIRPAKWREFFRPKYQELFDIVRNAGKRVFVHSDGYIVDIYPDLIEMGVSALNSQVWCMGLDTLAPFAGQITFWGELSRQTLLPHGTPAEIAQAAAQMVTAFYRNGGLIGQGEVDGLTPLENVEALLSCWGKIPLPM